MNARDNNKVQQDIVATIVDTLDLSGIRKEYVKRLIRDFVENDYQYLEKYGVTLSDHRDGVISYDYILRRTNARAIFYDFSGNISPFDKVVNDIIADGALIECDNGIGFYVNIDKHAYFGL